jgi:hypothetical protein
MTQYSLNKKIRYRSWLYNQIFSSTPDTSVESGLKFLKMISKGLLMIGAITSVSFTAPTFFMIWSNLFPYYSAVFATVFCVLLIFFLTDLAFGSLLPFIIEYTVSNRLSRNFYSLLGGSLLWLVVSFLGFVSMYFTWNGAPNPVQMALPPPQKNDIAEFEEKKQEIISIEEKRYKHADEALAREKSELSSLKRSEHIKILEVEKRAIKKYGKGTNSALSKIEKARQDSSIRVDKFNSTNSKSLTYLKERELALTDARASWNRVVEEKNKENDQLDKMHQIKVSSALMIIQCLGSGSTLIFFILQIIIALIKLGDEPENSAVISNSRPI